LCFKGSITQKREISEQPEAGYMFKDAFETEDLGPERRVIHGARSF